MRLLEKYFLTEYLHKNKKYVFQNNKVIWMSYEHMVINDLIKGGTNQVAFYVNRDNALHFNSFPQSACLTFNNTEEWKRVKAFKKGDDMIMFTEKSWTKLALAKSWLW